MTLLSVRRARVGGPPSRMLHYLPMTALLLDLILIATSCGLAVWGRLRLGIFQGAADVSSSLTVVGPLLVLGWVALVAVRGGYEQDVFGVGTDEYKRVLNASLIAASLLGVGCYLAKFPLSRGFFVLAFAVGIPLLILGRYLLRRAVKSARRQGKLQLRVLIAGLPSHVDEIAGVLHRESWLGYRVVGALTPTIENDATGSGIPVVGTCDQVTAIAKDSDVDVLFFAGGALTSSTQLRRIAWDLEHDAIQVVVAPNVADVSSERVRIRPVGGLPLMHIDSPRSTEAVRLGKRAFDAIGAAALIVVLAPLLAVIAMRIKINDGGPVLFSQTRIGRDGRPFQCHKFRTMAVNSEDRVKDLLAETGQPALLFKMKDDPRITRPGRWIRRYSLDELPQLFNVLLGSMSLVGPRPQVAQEVAMYQGAMSRRLRVRPGMTGLWQVSGRSDLSVEEAIRLDLYYVDNWSMIQDLTILARTIQAVFSSRGAY